LTEIKRRNLPRGFAFSLVLVALVAATIVPDPVAATVLEPVGHEQLVQQAQLIFEGVVTAVQYRLSDVGTPDHVALPHTFVTFTVKQTFKGKSATGSSITLRFQGGLDGHGSALIIPGVPLFDVGERSILFVRGNGTDLCPLVGWEQGRFRVIGDAIYTDDGQELWVTPHGAWARGPQHALDEVVTHNLGGTPLTFEVSPSPTSETLPPGAQRLHAVGVRSLVSGLVSRLHTSEQLARLPPVASAAIQDPFYVISPRPSAAPALPAASGRASLAEEQNAVEEPPVSK